MRRKAVMSSGTHCERPVFSAMVVYYKMNADSSWQDPEPQSCLLLVPAVSPEPPHQGISWESPAVDLLG